MEDVKRVLFCASPDLNYIDGSSIWAQTFALALAATGGTEVDYIAKSRPERVELYQPLRQVDAINIIDGADQVRWDGRASKRLTSGMMAELAARLHLKRSYDVIVVRGLEIAVALLAEPQALARAWIYLTDIPQDPGDYTAELREQMKRIADGCKLLLCQTQGFVELWKKVVPTLALAKVEIYTPVIPDYPASVAAVATRPVRAIYAGKFKPEWKTLEMAQRWPEATVDMPGAQLVMIGDKIHNDKTRPSFQHDMQSALRSTPRLTWLGAQSRERVQEEMRNARVGLSWRTATMDDTVEYSTKILEYGGAGCAAILNRTSLHESLLGQDYPLYADSADQYDRQLRRALLEPEVAQAAADRLRALASRHTFSRRVSDIAGWLRRDRISQIQSPAALPQVSRPLRVLVAGHDLKFFLPLKARLEEAGIEFVVDQWLGHNRHDQRQSLQLLQEADVIFCEWCLGNLQWYSRHKLPHQRLIARFHAQEARLPYMAQSTWTNIDHVVFVSNHVRDAVLATLSDLPLEKTSVVSNFLDSKKFTARKKHGDARFTLGMIGMVPMSKRFDRALDVLEILLSHDKRYCLRIKGKQPDDFPWIKNRPAELEYYGQLFARINANPDLRYRIIFDPPGDDVNTWLSMVGFILSPSNHESFHMAVGEAMLSDCVPVIWRWDGADELWPSTALVNGVEEAANMIREHTGVAKSREFVVTRHSDSKVVDTLTHLFTTSA